MAKNVTINKVAERAGVSRGTVDRVLNQRPHVRPDVRERVIRAMRELDYVPPSEEQARILGLNLPQNRAAVKIGVVIPNWQGYFQTEVLKAIAEAKERLDPRYTDLLVERCETSLSDECLEKIEKLEHRKVAGIALCAMDHVGIISKIHQLHEKGIPVVTFNSDITGSDRICFVGQDVLRSGRVAGELMTKYLRPEDDLLSAIGNFAFRGHRMRLQGFCQRLHEEGFSGYRFEVIETYNDYMLTYQQIRASLEKNPKIRGIYMANENVSGCVEAIRAVGAEGRIMVVCHDLTEENKRFLLQKKIGFTITQDIHGDAVKAIIILREYVENHTLPASLTSPIDIICAENLI